MQNHLYLKGAPLRNRHRASHRQFRKSYPTFFLFSNTDPRPVTNICALKFWNHPFRTWQYYTINESILGATHESNPFNSFVSAKTNLLPFSKLELSQKHPFEVEKVTTLVPGLSPARLLGCSTFLNLFLHPRARIIIKPCHWFI